MNFVLELFCIVIVIGWYCWNCGGTRREGSKRASSTVKVDEERSWFWGELGKGRLILFSLAKMPLSFVIISSCLKVVFNLSVPEYILTYKTG